MNCSPPGSSVHGILLARTLQWVVMPSSTFSSWSWNRTHGLLHLLHCRQILYCWTIRAAHSKSSLFESCPKNCEVHNLHTSTLWLWQPSLFSWKWKWSHSVVSESLWPPWTIVYQASLSMGFSRQEYWSGLPFPSLGDLPDPGIKPRSPALQADALPSEPSPRDMIILEIQWLSLCICHV